VPHSRPTVEQDDVEAVASVLASGKIAQGEKVREFEKALAAFVGIKYAVACSSGTSALHLALLGLGVGVGDEVIIPSYVCSSPYFATLHVGAVPRIADIGLSDLNLCVDTVKRQVSPKTRAVILPHMFGTPAEIDEVLTLGIPIVEDCAQALGAELRGRRVGGFGDVSVFSFYATKMITTGEGGMVLTSDDELGSRIVEARAYDKKPLTSLRFNYKMTDFQAALGLSQFRKLPRFIQRRREVASLYDKRFSGYGIGIPRVASHKKSVFYRYVVRVDDAEDVQKRVKKRGVMCEKAVPEPLNRSFPVFKCPNSDQAWEQALSVPLYPSLSEAEIAHVLETFDAIFG
jgi:perosamine synthetase